jgi:hypothetical protein
VLNKSSWIYFLHANLPQKSYRYSDALILLIRLGYRF